VRASAGSCLRPGLEPTRASAGCASHLDSIGPSNFHRLPPLLFHEARPEPALGLELIVGLTETANVVDRRLAAAGDRLDVIELHLPGRATTPPVLADVGAATAIALPHLCFDLG